MKARNAPSPRLFDVLKVASTLVDLLFVEIMSHLSHVKQIYNQPIHLTHEFILCIQIRRRRVDVYRDSAVKSPCWHQVSNLQTSDLDLSRFAAIPSEQDLAILITVTAPLDCSLDFFAFIEKIHQTHSRVSTSFRGGPLLSLRRCNSSLSNNNILKCLRSQTTFSIGCPRSIFFHKYGLSTFLWPNSEHSRPR